MHQPGRTVTVAVKFYELMHAFEFVSVAGPFDNRAYVDAITGCSSGTSSNKPKRAQRCARDARKTESNSAIPAPSMLADRASSTFTSRHLAEVCNRARNDPIGVHKYQWKRRAAQRWSNGLVASVPALPWRNLRPSNSVSSKTPLAYRRDDSDKLLPCKRTNRAASASAKRGPPS